MDKMDQVSKKIVKKSVFFVGLNSRSRSFVFFIFTTAKMPKAKKAFYQRMKRIYKLPDPPEKIRLEKELNAILEKGGDISQLMK